MGGGFLLLEDAVWETGGAAAEPGQRSEEKRASGEEVNAPNYLLDRYRTTASLEMKRVLFLFLQEGTSGVRRDQRGEHNSCKLSFTYEVNLQVWALKFVFVVVLIFSSF